MVVQSARDGVERLGAFAVAVGPERDAAAAFGAPAADAFGAAGRAFAAVAWGPANKFGNPTFSRDFKEINETEQSMEELSQTSQVRLGD